MQPEMSAQSGSPAAPASTRRAAFVSLGTVGLAAAAGFAATACATGAQGSAPAGRPTAAPGAADHVVDLRIGERHGAPPGSTPEFFFEPTGLAIKPGQTVRFRALTPHHTVTAYHSQHVKTLRVPEGVPPFSSPVLPVGDAFDYTFTLPGVYDLWCAPHEFFGMVMRLVVGEATGPGARPSTDFSPTGTTLQAGAVLNDPALAPDRILQRGKVSWTEIDPASKRNPLEAG